MGASSGSAGPADPLPSTPAIDGDVALCRQLRRQVLRARCEDRRAAVEVRHGRRTAVRGERTARHAAEEPDDRRCLRRLPVEPGRGGRLRCTSAAATATSTRSMPLSGELHWKFQTGDVVHASPAYADGVVFFGSWDSYFYAVDARTGQEKWRFHGGEDAVIHNQVGFQSSPAVVNGVVYTGCRDSKLYAIDAATGSEKWRFNASGSWVISSPAVAHGKVIFGTSDSSLYIVARRRQPARSSSKQQGKAYMFSSPRSPATPSTSGVLNGTLEARDLDSGDAAVGVPDRSVEAQRRLGADRGPEVQHADALPVRTGARRRSSRRRSSSASARSSRRRSSSTAWSTSAAPTATCTRSSSRP